MSAITIITLGVSVVTLALVLVTARLMAKQRARCRADLEVARSYREEGERMVYWAKQAKLVLHREDPDEPIQPHLSVVIDHKEDPVLRPYKLLMILLPDPDFEEVHELGQDQFATVVTTSAEANKAMAEADYVIVCKDADARVLKWRDRSEEQVEIEFYGVAS